MRLVCVLLVVLIAYGASFRMGPRRLSTHHRPILMRTSQQEELSSSTELSPEIMKEFNAIRRYREIHGNVMVPADFVVPLSDFSWPEESWGMALGKVVTSIKTTTDYDGYRTELEDMGFKYQEPSAAASSSSLSSGDGQTGDQSKAGFDFGNIVTYGLYGWIGFLLVDTIKIVATKGEGPSFHLSNPFG